MYELCRCRLLTCVPWQVVPTARSHLQRWAEVVNHSDRSVTLIDLCGHEKYLKTTVFGLTGNDLQGRGKLSFFFSSPTEFWCIFSIPTRTMIKCNYRMHHHMSNPRTPTKVQQQ